MVYSMQNLKLSVVIPVFNEQDSLGILLGRLLPVLEQVGPSEVIFVNDGSTDETMHILNKLQQAHPEVVRVIHLRTNCSKSVALQIGFNETCGRLIAMMDGDLQDQPEELLKLINTLEKEELDAVTGWKVNRQDDYLSKNFPSKIFNWIMRRLSDLHIHDFNCGLKVFRRECLGSFTLYGQLHRFILVFIKHHGFKVGEIGIEHAPRQFGFSKYGARRIYHGFMDILTVFFITRYLHSPLHFFGIYGVATLGLSVPIGAFYLGCHLFYLLSGNLGWSLAEHPLWLISPILFLIGLVMIFFGLLGEMLTYCFSSRNSFYSFVQCRYGCVKAHQTEPENASCDRS